jgi:O-acetyl-ADP-ribose deacetylase (regulator of RNase III)
MTEYYDPSLPNVDELIKRTQIGEKTNEFIRTTTGKAIIERALNQYKDGIESLQSMVFQEWSGSSEEELKYYRKISLDLATPLSVLKWLNAIIYDGETASKLAKYKEQ